MVAQKLSARKGRVRVSRLLFHTKRFLRQPGLPYSLKVNPRGLIYNYSFTVWCTVGVGHGWLEG